MLGKAIALAARVFEGVKDKAGKAYILHCLRVMNGVSHLSEEAQVAAVLHDVVEDFKVTRTSLEDIAAMGFHRRSIELIALLTHDKENVPYMDYVKKLAHDEDAKAIKKSDLKDNSDITRLRGLTKKDHDRMEKYHTAWVYLS